MAEEKLDHIEELEKRLYARDPEAVPKRTYGILHPLKNKVDSSWGENSLPDKARSTPTTVSGYKKFFIFSFIFFLLALGAVLFSIYKGALTLSSKNVEMSILGNSFVSGGESMPIQIDIQNKNSADLVDAELTISYPRGSIDQGEANIQKNKIPIGVIASGKTKTQSSSVILYGEQGTSRTITATLEYKLSGSNTIFVKESSFSVMINSSPMSLTVDAPSSIVSNQPFSITIRSVFSGDDVLNDAVISASYPSGFIFDSATPLPSSEKSNWLLGDMVKGTERTITIKGRLVGDQQDEKAFHFYVGPRTSDSDPKISVAYNSVLHSIVIAEPFLSGTINVGSTSSDVVAINSGSPVVGTISFVNNSPLRISNPKITMTIVGDAVDTSSIKSEGGYYNPLEKSLSWTIDSSRNLETLEPGEIGQLAFSFSTKNLTTGEIVLSLSVAGTFPDRDLLEESITNIDQKVIRFASRIQFASQSLYSIGPIKNTGPFPPKVGQETSYSISWTMKSVENPLANAVATATLPLGVSWAGVIYPSTESLSYDPETRKISWNIGGVQKSVGSPSSRSVSFQVKIRPDKSQADDEVELLSETNISATDTVANVEIKAQRPPVTTVLSSDPAYSTGKEKVLP